MRNYLLLFVLIIVACEKPYETVETNFYGRGYLVCNEGNFTFGNATLSYVSEDLSTAENEVFARANGISLGDVLQSAKMLHNQLYLVVNNSSKIWVCNPNDFSIQANITGLVSPRNIVQLSDTSAIISDLRAPFLTVFDTRTHQVIKELQIDGSSEQMVVVGNFLYTNSWTEDNRIHKIDIKTLEKVAELTVPNQPINLEWNGNKLWVASQGNDDENTSLSTINLDDFSLESTYYFPNKNASVGGIHYGELDQKLYFISNQNPWDESKTGGLFAVNPLNVQETNVLVENGNRLFYNYFYDAAKQQHVICDAKDYLQAGDVLFYDSNFNLLAQKTVSIIPGDVIYKPN